LKNINRLKYQVRNNSIKTVFKKTGSLLRTGHIARSTSTHLISTSQNWFFMQDIRWRKGILLDHAVPTCNSTV